jgi:drug/metabolite transporter (DMT)-like permease
MIKSYWAKGVLWAREDSFYIRRDGTFNVVNITLSLLRGLISLAGYTLSYIMQRTSYTSGINASVIISLLAMTSFLTAFLFYLIFKEKLMTKHFIGMIAMVTCVIMISVSNS